MMRSLYTRPFQNSIKTPYIRRCDCNNMSIYLQAHSLHAGGVFYAIVAVYSVILWKYLNNFPVGWYLHNCSCVFGPHFIVRGYLFIRGTDCYHSFRIHPLDVGAVYVYCCLPKRYTRDAFCLADGLVNRSDYIVNMNYLAFSHA